MRTITLDRDSYQLPGNWNELSQEELEFLAQQLKTETPVQQIQLYMMLYCLHGHIEAAPRHFGSDMLRRLGKHAYTTLVIGEKRYRLETEQFVQLGELMNFLVNPVEQDTVTGNQPPRYCVALDLTNDPYPILVIDGIEYRGSGDGLMNMRFEQYMYLQTYLNGMLDSCSQLEDVLACVWCPEGEFNVEQLEITAADLRTLPSYRKMVMLWFIQSSLQAFSKMFPRIFNGGGSGEKHCNVFDAQLRLLDSLAQHDMTKKDQVRRGWLMDAFYSLDEILKEQERMEEKLKK